MKNVLLSLAAASALAAAALPAAAQGYGGWDGPPRQERGIVQGDHLQMRIDRAEHDGRIGHRMADRLRDQLRVADRMAWSYRRDGVVTRYERADLDRRYEDVASTLRWASQRAERDGGYRDGGYRDDWRR
jgi:hypothetical protein